MKNFSKNFLSKMDSVETLAKDFERTKLFTDECDKKLFKTSTEIAYRYDEMKMFDDAETFYLEAFNLKNCVLSRRNLGFFYFRCKKFELAERYLLENKDDSESMVTLGTVYVSMKRYEEAVKYLKPEIDHKNVAAMTAFSISLLNLGRESEAEQCLIEASKLKDVFATSVLGEFYYSKKIYPLAEVYSLEAVFLGNKKSMYVLGKLYFKTDWFLLAKQFLTMALDAGFDDAGIYLGKIYGLEGDKNLEEQILLRIALKGNVDAMNALGMFYFTHENFEEAENYLVMALGNGSQVAELNLNACFYSVQNCLEKDCSICYEKMEGKNAKLHCGHWFHRHCIKTWIARTSNGNRNCPMCRNPIGKLNQNRVFSVFS